MHLRMVILLPALLLLSCDQGCTADAQDDIFAPDFEWRGENVTVYGLGYTEADLCAGSLTALDQRIELIESFLGLDSTRHYEFGWVAPDVWAQTSCAHLDGCAGRTSAWGLRLPHMHEAAHMIGSTFECPPILSEGLADYLDDPDYTLGFMREDLDIEDLIDRDDMPLEAGAYPRAAHFTSYLLETYGLETVLELCRAIPEDDSLADWEAAVPEVMNMSFDDLWWLYSSEYPWCSSHQLRARLWGCAGTPDFVLDRDDPQRREYHFEAGCSDSRTTNAAKPKYGGAATTRLIHVVSDDHISVEAQAEGPSGTPARFTLQQCATCIERGLAVRGKGGSEIDHEYRVGPGFYEVTLYFDRRDRAALTITAGVPY